MKRSANGKVLHEFKIVRPEDMKKKERPDPVLYAWSDPEKVNDRRLRQLMCTAGGAKICPACEAQCAYGREFIRRKQCGKKQDTRQA